MGKSRRKHSREFKLEAVRQVVEHGRAVSEVADSLGVSMAMVIALQAVGAAAGNMIAIHNVVAAAATVGLLGQEGPTLRRTLLPTLYYLFVVGIMGLFAIHVLQVGDPLL